MLLHRRIPRQDRNDAILERSSARLLHQHLSTLDRAEAREEAVETLAAEIYDRHIGRVIAARDISEAIGEIFAGMDDQEHAACRKAFADGDHAFGAWLRPKVSGYWSAWATDQAQQQLDKLDREAEDDHYRTQVAA